MSTFLSDEDIDLRVRSVRDSLATEIPRARSKRRKRRVIIAGAATAAAALTGAALVIHATNDQIHYEVTCFESADLNSKTVQVQSALGVDDHGHADRTETDPIESCGEVWRMGLLGQPTPPPDTNTANFDIPELVGCTLPNGASGGFPRGESAASVTEFCNELGLAPWE